MSDPFNIEASINSSYVTKRPELRFVKRDGKLMLQYAELRRYRDRQEVVWVDVPVAEEQEET